MSGAVARAARAPVLIAAAIALAYLLIAPASGDLAAQEYRVALVRDHGFGVWDGGWYGGHHTPGYSVLFPPLGALLGARIAGGLAVVAAAALFAILVERRWGERAELGAVWFAVGVGAWLFTGRLTFLLGVALGLGSLVAAQRRRTGFAVLLAALTGLGSPIAALFVALAGVAWAVGAALAGARGGREEVSTGDAGRPGGGDEVPTGEAESGSGELRRDVVAGLLLAAAALAPVVLLAVAFPEGGSQPFLLRYVVPPLLLAVGGLALLPPEERALRAGVVLYALAAVAAAAIDTPVGVNVTRLGALFAGPVLACVLAGRRPRALAVIALPLLYWQLYPPVRDTLTAAGDPSTAAGYHRPLLDELRRLGGPPGRVEVPPLREHGEARFVAREVPLARGWERQLDRERARLFYDGSLTPATYRAWLADNAVRRVALADAPLDPAAKAEAALIRRGLPYLRPVWRSAHWRLYALTAPGPLVRGAGRAVALGATDVVIDAARAGPLDVRVRSSPYWALTGGSGCLRSGPKGWMRVDAHRPGRLRLAIRFAPGRVLARGPRCRSG